MRIVTANTRVPVAFAPCGNRDQQPWVTYDPARSVRTARYTSAECTKIPVTSDDQDPGHRVDRSILSRLEAAGIHCSVVNDLGGSHHLTDFADGSYLQWSAYDCYGEEGTVGHPISENAYLSAYWASESAEDSADFRSGVYERDSAALIAWILRKANRHGRRSSMTGHATGSAEN
ncbi:MULTISPECIES: hypothetical protein [unclassified Streptomyces]|uniref:hypothetical protein n=1 Tax=unclassified Streptomyces TaxID=2593676 RepID=UPI003D8F3B98